MKIIKEDIQEINLSYFLGFIILINYLFLILLKEYLITNNIYYDAFEGQLSLNRINDLISYSKKWSWLSYIILPVVLFLKITFTTICLKIGAFFYNFELNLKQFLRLVILAEIPFILSSLIRIIWFFINSDSLTLKYIQTFYPLSLINLFEVNNISPYLIYPLQIVNLFELLHWIILAYLIKIFTNESFDKSFGFVAKTYGIGLFTWIVLVVFLSIN